METCPLTLCLALPLWGPLSKSRLGLLIGTPPIPSVCIARVLHLCTCLLSLFSSDNTLPGIIIYETISPPGWGPLFWPFRVEFLCLLSPSMDWPCGASQEMPVESKWGSPMCWGFTMCRACPDTLYVLSHLHSCGAGREKLLFLFYWEDTDLEKLDFALGPLIATDGTRTGSRTMLSLSWWTREGLWADKGDTYF